MSRRARHCLPGSFQHVISRFVDHRFRLIDDVDRSAYLTYFSDAAGRWDWRALSYALMSSHVHHGVQLGQMPVGDVFHGVHTKYAMHWRRRYGGLGPVFADRPKTLEVDASRVWRMIVYHHRNPVTAHVVATPGESRWSSHRAYLRLDRVPSWLDVECGLSLCGFSDTATGRRQFDEFVREVSLDDEMGGGQSKACAHISGGRPAPRAFSDADWELLSELACCETGLSTTLLSSRKHTAVAAKCLFLLVARQCGHSYRTAATRLGFTKPAAVQLLRRHAGLCTKLAASCGRIRDRLER